MKELGSLGFETLRLRRVEESIAHDIDAQRYDGAALRVHQRLADLVHAAIVD